MFKSNLLKISILLFSLFNFLEADDNYNKNRILMSKIVNQSIKQLTNRYGINFIGRGESVRDLKSKTEGASFTIYKKISKDEARVLIVEIVELFLHNINGNQAIAPHLYDSPFTYKNLDCVVFIYNEDGLKTYHPDVGVVSITRGIVTFNTYDPDKFCKYLTDEEETYEEAYKIVTQRRLDE